MADSLLDNRLAALQLVVLSLPRAPAVLLRSGSQAQAQALRLLQVALGSASPSQWRPPGPSVA